MDGIGEADERARACPDGGRARARCNASREDVLEARAAASAHFAESLDRPEQDAGDDDVRERLVGTEDPGYARAEQTADLDRMLSRLSERERTVVRLRFQEDMVQREIGARLGISQMQVSRVLKQAISTLQAVAPATCRATLRVPLSPVAPRLERHLPEEQEGGRMSTEVQQLTEAEAGASLLLEISNAMVVSTSISSVVARNEPARSGRALTPSSCTSSARSRRRNATW